MNLKTSLKGKLTKKEMKILNTSFDIIGSREKAVAIIEIPDELKKKEEVIGKTILKVHKNVKSVLKKSSGRKGIFRLRKYKIISGEKNTEVLHRESGCRFILNPKKVYFSTREGTERERVAEDVKNGEKILVLFGGIAPFPIVIAKKKNAKIYSVEINPAAHEYAIKNVILNKVGDRVTPILGDAREVCKILGEKFDRITMHLPENAYEFLNAAFSCSKKGTIIYMYGIEEEGSDELNKKTKEHAKKNGVKIRILGKRKVLPYSPRTFKFCVKIKVL